MDNTRLSAPCLPLQGASRYDAAMIKLPENPRPVDKPFFPASKRFWVLHLGCWFSLYIFIVFVQVLTGQGGVKMQAVGGLVYVGLGAFGGLLYRYLFYALGWDRYSIARVTAVSLVFVILHGALVGSLIVCYVFVLRSVAPDWMVPLPPQMPHKYFLFLVFVSNAINITVFQSMWSAIYIAVATWRRSLRREVESLKLENALKEAQLNILSSQLNPHFLFNALNNIRFMMRKDAHQAETMLTHLSDLLRYALESSREEKVSLQRELETVSHYISLAQIQFNNRLNFSQEVYTDVHHLLVPPMMLQMLVENAVKHGTEQLKEGGELQLVITRQKQNLRIQVRNDFARAKSKPLRTNDGFGIGLNNIERRLQLLYGEQASLKSRAEGDTWIATLNLPCEESAQ